MKKLITYGTPKTEGKNWLADLETTEKEQTGIKNLQYQIQQSLWLLPGSYQISCKDQVPDHMDRGSRL